MTIEIRLKEERNRMGFNQPDFAALGSKTKKTLIDYEKGKTSPDAVFLAAISAAGADVQYILTGVPGYKPEPPSVLETVRQQRLIEAAESLKLTKLADLPGKQGKSKHILTEITDGVRITATQADLLDSAAFSNDESKTQKIEYLPVEHTGNDEKHAAEELVDYEALRPDQLALLDNLAHCPREVQDAIKRLALVSARADRDEAQSGTE